MCFYVVDIISVQRKLKEEILWSCGHGDLDLFTTRTQYARDPYLLPFSILVAKWSNLSVKGFKSWSINYRLCHLLHCLVLET